MSAEFPTTRLRRRRYHPKLRGLLQENNISVNDVVYPLFINESLEKNKPINSMPGQYQLSLKTLANEINTIVELGIPAVLLFGIPTTKDATGSNAYQEDGVVQQAIKLIKDIAPDLLVISDICCCEYTEHGHCGIIDWTMGSADVNNDKTLEILKKQALSHAEAGADVLAPSGMMDGMVAALRQVLDENNFNHLPILSYAVKYASAFYGPFRDAADGAPSFGDRHSHQMNPANGREAIIEAELDIQEGADMLMVKPGLHYLDVVQNISSKFPQIPLCAYHVSGEYAMLKAAAEKGWLNEKDAVLESMLCFKRAGADFIITYYAKDIANWLKN